MFMDCDKTNANEHFKLNILCYNEHKELINKNEEIYSPD